MALHADIDAFLFDRDGTLIVDVPYNGNPEAVTLMPTVAETLKQLRSMGFLLGVVTNQSGIARGLVREEDVLRVNSRVEELVGPIDVWRYCPHGPLEKCACRKPAPGMIISAARELRTVPSRVAMIGDIGSDVQAARAAGAHAVLVPTPATLRREIDDSTCTAETLAEAVEFALNGKAAQ